MYERGYWDALIEELAKEGVKVYDNRGRYGKNYSKSSWSDDTIGVHDTSNPRGSAPTNPAIRSYDVVVSKHKGEPYVMFNRPIDARRGSVYGANDEAGPQVAYGGPVGGDPSELELGLLGRVTDKLKTDFSGKTVKGHGELYKEGPRGGGRYSKHGRHIDEGQWYADALAMQGVPEHQRVKPGLTSDEMARLGLEEPAGPAIAVEETITPPEPTLAAREVGPTLTAREVDTSLAASKPKPFAITEGHPMAGRGEEMVAAVNGASKPAIDIPVTSVRTAEGVELKDITPQEVPVSEFNKPEDIRHRALIAELERGPKLVREGGSVSVGETPEQAEVSSAIKTATAPTGGKGGPQTQTPWSRAMLHQMETGDSSMLDEIDAAAPVQPLTQFEMPKFNFKLGSLLGGLF